MIGCDSLADAPLATPERSFSEASTPLPSDEEAARSLARGLAFSLRDHDVRSVLLAATKGSNVKEGKLHFRTFLLGAGRVVLDRMGQAPNSSVSNVLSQLDQVGVDLELYLPVPEHRLKWDGSELVVAAALDDQMNPYGVDADGNDVWLARDTPPDSPVIALVPAESFAPTGEPRSGHVRHSDSNLECDPDAIVECDPEPGTGGGSFSWLTVPNWIYLTKLILDDDGEGWPNGEPEIDIFTVVRATTSGAGQIIRCVGEEETGELFFNWDDGQWEGYVRIATPVWLEGLPPEEGLLFQAWEDDDEPCAIKVSNGTVSDLIGAVDAAASGYDGLALDIAGIQYAFSFIGSILNVFSGSDDPVGGVVKQSCIRAGMAFEYAVIKSGGVNGCARLFLNTVGTAG
ncbi:MAG: hypothetical protein RQ751_05940 [Longimicrobiales bacterium]|nr:hypothetical protein [Longimicrobiales bacterium]